MRIYRAVRYVVSRTGWFFAGWLTAAVSGLIAGKGIDQLRVEVDTLRPVQPPRDPYDYGGPDWAGDGCKGRPIVLPREAGR
jgi:hypothetical protein